MQWKIVQGCYYFQTFSVDGSRKYMNVHICTMYPHKHIYICICLSAYLSVSLSIFAITHEFALTTFITSQHHRVYFCLSLSIFMSLFLVREKFCSYYFQCIYLVDQFPCIQQSLFPVGCLLAQYGVLRLAMLTKSSRIPNLPW